MFKIRNKHLLKYSGLLSLLPLSLMGATIANHNQPVHANHIHTKRVIKKQHRTKRMSRAKIRFRHGKIRIRKNKNFGRKHKSVKKDLIKSKHTNKRVHRIHKNRRAHNKSQRNRRFNYTSSIKPIQNKSDNNKRTKVITGSHNNLSQTQINKMFKIANSKLGDRYVWGGNGPRIFDCSGYTKYVYKHALHITLPRIVGAQYNASYHVPESARKPGDLVFFGTSKQNLTHVGLYRGDDSTGHPLMEDAQNRGVIIERIHEPWWNFQGYGAPKALNKVAPRFVKPQVINNGNVNN